MDQNRMPGYIKFTREAVYARYPDLDARIAAHIAKWRDSVDFGASATIDEMLNFQDPGNHGMPVEIVMIHLFPLGGGPCAVPGVEGVSDVMPKRVRRTA
ncbi:hypothetical protein [Streptomyces graminilatus]|uniref:hypothetical protein n=1 Tax=Streptomyces graminilatus TaxID=1464070 RepID=UPI0006E3F568|nr:hypothetical protein [Streptomyces graminilatus]